MTGSGTKAATKAWRWRRASVESWPSRSGQTRRSEHCVEQQPKSSGTNAKPRGLDTTMRSPWGAVARLEQRLDAFRVEFILLVAVAMAAIFLTK